MQFNNLLNLFKMKQSKIFTFLLVIASVLFFSCKKDNKGTANNSRMVKYEITGNFSGKLTIVYSDNVNGNTELTDISLPWSKEITYPNNIVGIGIGASHVSNSTLGIAGQTATMKIYSGGTVVKSSTATANSVGGILIPTLGHGF